MKNLIKLLVSVCLVSVLFGMVVAQPAMAQTEVAFWVRWSGDEFNAMKQIVDKYNSLQNEIYVNLLSVSDLETKFYTAVAAGNPPDLVHVMSHQVPSWAEKNALYSLENISTYGIDLSKYVARYLDLGKHNGQLYAMPVTPAIVVLYWNKELFREAGLDPNKPPKTIDEFNEYMKKLTKYDDKGDIIQLGFDPLTPGWWPPAWCYFFGGKLYEPQTKRITANAPENIKAYEWLRDFIKEFGMEKLQRFRAGFGPYWSAENAFIAGKVAMSYDGIWKAHLIDCFAPELDWGVTAFPSVDGKMRVYIEGDYIGIPVGTKYPEAAKKFLAYLEKPENLEQINLAQWKIPALNKLSEGFIANHPNKSIKEFVRITEMAEELFCWPRTPVWSYYLSQWWDVAIPKVTLLKDTPQNVLNLVQKKVEKEQKK